MPERNVMVWDLETVPDLEAAGRMLGMEGAPDREIRAALGAGFPKHPLHKIACIGALVAERQSEGWQIHALGAPHLGQRTETELIRSFIDRIGELRPQLITFNGHSFDLPVLRYRAMVNRVPAVGLQIRPYFHRYAEDALDLCDVFGSYTPGAKVKLDEICKIVGLPGKASGIDGSDVEAMVQAGRIAEIAQYCEADVLNTYRLWLIYELFRGAITAEQLAFSEAQAADFARLRKTENPQLTAAVSGISDGDSHAGAPGSTALRQTGRVVTTFQELPIVRCPGCSIPMNPINASPSSENTLREVIYECSSCGTQTTRVMRTE